MNIHKHSVFVPRRMTLSGWFFFRRRPREPALWFLISPIFISLRRFRAVFPSEGFPLLMISISRVPVEHSNRSSPHGRNFHKTKAPPFIFPSDFFPVAEKPGEQNPSPPFVLPFHILRPPCDTERNLLIVTTVWQERDSPSPFPPLKPAVLRPAGANVIPPRFFLFLTISERIFGRKHDI